MGEKVSHIGRHSAAGARFGDRSETALYGRKAGDRKYLNAEERRRVLGRAASLPDRQALFLLTLAWTGARVSEVLALCPASFQVEQGMVTIRTLKRRRFSMREVPIPPELMTALDRHFGIVQAQCAGDSGRGPLWPWCRQTAWRVVKRVMTEAEVRGLRASPRGLRHAFGVGTLQAGVPLNLVQRWLGHASMQTTAIYADASGPEEAAFAARFWYPTNDNPISAREPGGRYVSRGARHDPSKFSHCVVLDPE